MISFRYHIASLVAVLLALGAGVALGAGPLQADDAPEPTSAGSSPSDSTPEETEQAAFSDAYAASLQSSIVSGRLQGRAVTLVVLPEADPKQVQALTEALGPAGATVAGTVRVSPTLVDASQRQLVDALGGQLEASANKVVMAADAGSYDRIGTLLAYATGTTTPGGDAVDQQGTGILAGLSTAGLISKDATLQRRGNLVVLVAGEPAGDAATARGTADIVLSLAKAFDSRTGGVVVAGPGPAAEETGVLTAVRDDPAASGAVSTVDNAETPAGVTVTVLALAEQAGKAAGQYGAGPGATGPRPGVAAMSP